MRAPADTIGVTPNRGPAMTKTLHQVCAELDVLTSNRYRTRLAVVLPPQRVISHDDQEPVVRHQFFIADWRDLDEMEKRNPRVRFKTIGAVIFPCTWERHDCEPRHLLGPGGDQPWILIKPEFMTDPNIVARFREAAEVDQEWWSSEGKAISMEMMEEEAAEEDAARARARKAAVTRRRNAKKARRLSPVTLNREPIDTIRGD